MKGCATVSIHLEQLYHQCSVQCVAGLFVGNKTKQDINVLKREHQRQGALQCTACGRWFRSKGGLAVHEHVSTYLLIGIAEIWNSPVWEGHQQQEGN